MTNFSAASCLRGGHTNPIVIPTVSTQWQWSPRKPLFFQQVKVSLSIWRLSLFIYQISQVWSSHCGQISNLNSLEGHPKINSGALWGNPTQLPMEATVLLRITNNKSRYFYFHAFISCVFLCLWIQERYNDFCNCGPNSSKEEEKDSFRRWKNGT